MAALSPCDICVPSKTGICIGNQTCVCLAGYLGPTCSDPVTTSRQSSTQINIVAIIAGVLGGMLFAFIVGLVIFFIWKRRIKKKSLTFSPSISSSTTTSSVPVVVPALYDLPLSRRDSTVTSSSTMTYHLYEELI